MLTYVHLHFVAFLTSSCLLAFFLPGFKEANIIPIHKKEDKEPVTNYCPVSLLSCASKVMERCVLNKIYPILKNQIYYLQNSFIKGRSCTTQMLYVLHHLQVLDCCGQIDVLYLDFSKAFDSVPHNLLLYPLNQYGINGSLLNWFSSYLMGRRQRVVIIESSFSDWLPVVPGVPQGSIFGPFLFLLYINDLPSIVSPEPSLALFADDSKCFRSTKALGDCLEFQDDVSAIKS